MRLSPIAPGHVVLRDPLWPRWLLLALAVGLAVPAIGLAFTLDFRGAPTLAAALAFTLLAGGVAAVSCRRAFELGPDGALRCRGPFRRRFAAAGRVAAVRLAAVRRAVAAGQYIDYTVELLAADTDAAPRLVGRSHREQRARRFAQALGRAAGLPLLDATGERVELRLPDALTGPPASRAELPPGPPPRGVAIDPDPLCGEVLRLAGRLGQRAALWCQDDVLHLAISWCGVPLRRRHVPVAAIERVRADGPAAGVEVLLAGRTIAFARWLPANARRFVAAWLASRLWPELPVRPEPSTAPAAGSLAPAL